MKPKAAKFYWHVHHGDLAEFLTEPLSVRRRYIRNYKPKDQVPLRLRLMKPVRGPIPARLRRAAKNFLNNRNSRVGEKYVNAYRLALPRLEKLHAKECRNCPWNGKTIFP